MSSVHFIFEDHLRTQGLKLTNQRKVILDIFLKTQRHVSVEELYLLVKKQDPAIGQTTVFRTLKLLCEVGLAGEVDFGDRSLRYEMRYGHEHHDHLVCVECGSYIEAMDPRIEQLQDTLCARFGFIPQKHRMEIYGVCRDCQGKG